MLHTMLTSCQKCLKHYNTIFSKFLGELWHLSQFTPQSLPQGTVSNTVMYLVPICTIILLFYVQTYRIVCVIINHRRRSEIKYVSFVEE